jgi:hypothetical protein
MVGTNSLNEGNSNKESRRLHAGYDNREREVTMVFCFCSVFLWLLCSNRVSEKEGYPILGDWPGWRKRTKRVELSAGRPL